MARIKQTRPVCALVYNKKQGRGITYDRELLADMMRRVDPTMTTQYCHHGLELMQFLENIPAGEYLPCCIILDVNMPIWDGMETLRRLKQHPEYAQLPAVMFTTSSSQRDAQRSIELGAAAFITKPIALEEVQKVSEFFFSFCHLELRKK